jgi:hypothetical protein
MISYMISYSARFQMPMQRIPTTVTQPRRSCHPQPAESGPGRNHPPPALPSDSAFWHAERRPTAPRCGWPGVHPTGTQAAECPRAQPACMSAQLRRAAWVWREVARLSPSRSESGDGRLAGRTAAQGRPQCGGIWLTRMSRIVLPSCGTCQDTDLRVLIRN